MVCRWWLNCDSICNAFDQKGVSPEIHSEKVMHYILDDVCSKNAQFHHVIDISKSVRQTGSQASLCEEPN